MSCRAVVNQKGGVGKTTTALTMAGLMQDAGRRQLLIDLDPHGSLTTYLGQDPDAVEAGAYRLFERVAAGEKMLGAPELALCHEGTGLAFIPGSPALATIDRRFGGVAGMGRVIARAVAELRPRYDDIWIDCSPTLGVIMVNALAACDAVLIPVQTEFLALKGLQRMLETLRLIEKSRGHPISRLIIPTMFDRRTRASIEALRTLRDNYENQLWAYPVPVDTRFRTASARGLLVSQLDPDSRGLRAYARVAEALLAAEKASEEEQVGT